jgi:hypothetical protein
VIVVVAPEPHASWLQHLIATADQPVVVLTFGRWRRLAQRIAVRMWVRGAADRRIRARLAIRRLADRYAARRLPGDVAVVYAPSFAARRTFAAAAARSATTRVVLVEDLPWLRELHDDLDRAAAHHPEAPFLQRFRAPARDVGRQEAEWVLAHRQLVFGHWAQQRRLLAGVAAQRVALCPWIAPSLRAGDTAPGGTRDARVLLLAGTGAARAGLLEAVEVVRRLHGTQLLVRGGEALEPRWVLDVPGVRLVTEQERAMLDGVDLVIAPAWCEAYPDEVPRAAARGIPVVATARAAGAVNVTATVEPGDVDGLVAACRGILGGS